MARMKFLCDADRCIECNACVTACKNEHEVPWGINRRRVVTINDGKPGERSISMACMHCTDAPCAAVCPTNCFYTTADAVVLHSKDICIGCGYCFYACPFGAPQYPKVGNFGSRGKMDKCTYCAGGPEGDSTKAEFDKYGTNRLARGQAAAVRRDVLDQVAAGRRRRHHRADLQGARGQARLRLRRLGLEDRLQRNDRDLDDRHGGRACANHASPPVSQAKRGTENSGRTRHGAILARYFAQARFIVGALALLFVVTLGPVSAQQQPTSVNPTASSVKEDQLLNALQGGDASAAASRIPDAKSGTLIQPAGRDWREFHQVTLPWIGAIADPRHAGAAGRCSTCGAAW